MLDTTLFKSKLQTLLTEEIRLSQSLLESIELKEKSLTLSFSKKKPVEMGDMNALLKALQVSSDKRIQLMEKQGFASDKSGFKSCAKVYADDSSLTYLMTKLEQKALQCFQRNRKLGQLINRQSQFVSLALQTISPARPESSTYGSDGQQGLKSRYQSIASA